MLENKMKTKRQPAIEKILVEINHQIDMAIFYCQSFQEIPARCPQCSQSGRIIELKEVKREAKTGWVSKFVGACSHTWSVTLFPIGPEAFEAEVKCQDQNYTVAVSKSNCSDETSK